MELIHRAFRALEALSDAEDGLGVSALSQQLSMPASSTHRLLATLAERDLVRQDGSTRRYRLGPGVLRMHTAYLAQSGLSEQVVPLLEQLTERLSETSFLTVLEGDQAVCVRVVDSRRPLNFFMRPGRSMPLHCTASAKALLSLLSSSQAAALLRRQGFTAYTPRTPTRVEQVLEDLEAVRLKGVAVSDGELDEGVTAIAAPLRPAGGRPLASITVLAPSERLAGKRRELATQLLLECADRAANHGTAIRAAANSRDRGPALPISNGAPVEV